MFRVRSGTVRVGIAGLALAVGLPGPLAGARERTGRVQAVQAPIATARLAGRVTAAGQGTPIPRVRVVATSSVLARPRIAITDADGRYVFEPLPAGLYTLTFSHGRFVPQSFGGTSPLAIELAERQHLDRIDVALEPAAVLRGRILDEDGSPLAGALVQALAPGVQDGQRTLSVAGDTRSDDRGEFRLHSLRIGRYLVSAADPAFEHAGDQEGALASTPTYYPGVSVAELATTVRAVAGAESAPLEFRLRLAKPAQVSGRLVTHDSRPLLSVAVIMSPQMGDRIGTQTVGEARIDPEGRFSFSRVPPGRYLIRARGATERDGLSLFSTFAVLVEGRDVSGVEMVLSPGGSIDGQVVIQPRHGFPPPTPGTLRVRAPLADGSAYGDTLTGSVSADGTFRLAGLMPGSHVLMVEGLAFPWRIAEARLQGRDITDTTFEAEGDQQFRNLRVVLTDSAAGVSGRVALPDGMAPQDVLVVAFPASALRRRVPLRFVRTARPRADGSYRLLDLVPGEYLVAAAQELTELDAMQPDVLDRLVPLATRLTLGEAKTASLPLEAVRLPLDSQL
jgi:hypothetical protein